MTNADRLREALGSIPGEHDYPTEPIGGGNPYWRCRGCGKAQPEISISGHGSWCSWAVERRAKIEAHAALDAMLADMEAKR